MANSHYDIIIIGAGSGGLSVGLFMAKAGFRIMMIVKTEHAVGGECLNDGCVPSKALIHVSRIVQAARTAQAFGMKVGGVADIQKAVNYVYNKQEIIRRHENADWLLDQGIEVAIGVAAFSGKNEVTVNGQHFTAKKIVLASGSGARKLKVPGAEGVAYYDNENIFRISTLPEKMLFVGAGPICIEMAQCFRRLGSAVTVIDRGSQILSNDDEAVTTILLQRLKEEGIEFLFNVVVDSFSSPNEALLKHEDGRTFTHRFDAVFVGIGRELHLDDLNLEAAGIAINDHKIVVDDRLRTTNKNVLLCGDIAGGLQFSHAAEMHGRLIINNLLSPLKKTLNRKHMSWVTFTDPELATFGYSEAQLKKNHIAYIKLEESFEDDDRAVVDNNRWGKVILFISEKHWYKKQVILGGTMVAPHAGELVQELILANTEGLSVNTIFNKIYPYPVASRINQKAVVSYKQKSLTPFIKRLLQWAFKIIS